ncbi:MAG TPA: hypothetical protein VIH89_16010 [Candidatus Sulfotelmatobacter sp.]
MFNAIKKFCRRYPVSRMAVALLVLSVGSAAIGAKELSVEELKARLASASTGERPHLCVEIAEKQFSSANKFYAEGETEKGQAALTDVAVFSESARDNSIQSGKHLKQTEIAVRLMTRKLTDLKHRVTHDEQTEVQGTIDRLQRVRDDLLAAMFHKGDK